MEKSKRNTRKRKGGRKLNNYGSTFITQTAGYKSILAPYKQSGGVDAATPVTYNDSAIISSLQSFGASMYNLQNVLSDTSPIDTARAAAAAQSTSTSNFNTAIVELYNAFRGTATQPGLYQAIYGPSAVFVPTPSS